MMKTTNRTFREKPRLVLVSLEPSKDVFPFTEMSLPAYAGKERVAELTLLEHKKCKLLPRKKTADPEKILLHGLRIRLT